jgi:cytochrome c
MNLERLTARVASCSLLLLLGGPSIQLAAAEGGTRAAVFNDGKQEFDENCVACHGRDGTGKGELGAKLVKPPKDLTTIAKANGGEFPFWRVFDIVAGDTDVPGHETFQMPLTPNACAVRKLRVCRRRMCGYLSSRIISRVSSRSDRTIAVDPHEGATCVLERCELVG